MVGTADLAVFLYDQEQLTYEQCVQAFERLRSSKQQRRNTLIVLEKLARAKENVNAWYELVTKSVRLEPEENEDLQHISKSTGLSEASLMKRFILEGLSHRLQEAIDASRGEIDLSAAQHATRKSASTR